MRAIRMITLILFMVGYNPLFCQDIYYIEENNNSGYDIIRLNLSDSKTATITKRIGNGHYPHFNNPKLSSDKETLVFQCDADGHDRYTIWTMKTDGSKLRKVTNKEGLFPNWSPDGKSIIFSGRRDGVWEILKISAEGGEEINLSRNKERGINPGWGATISVHSNGDSFIFSYIREEGLYSFDLETSKISELYSSGRFTHPIYSNKSDSYAVMKKGKNGYNLIIVRNKEEELIANSVASWSAPDWSDDDRSLLFSKSVNGENEIFMYDLATSKISQVTSNGKYTIMPLW